MNLIIDLHCHLDGSLPTSVVALLMEKYPERVPEKLKPLLDLPKEAKLNALKNELQAPTNCKSLAEYLVKFDLPCTLLQDAWALQIAVVGLLRKLTLEGVKYVELRFAPQLHSLNVPEEDKLQYEAEFLRAMIEARQMVPQIECSFILCTMRNLPDGKVGERANQRTLRLAQEFLGRGVCAVDLAGAEARDATYEFSRLFAMAREMKIPFTIHAGEAGNREWRLKSIQSAIEFGTKRIGHGIALEHSPELRAICKERAIGIECCPISNLQTKAVCGGIGYHPLPRFLEEGLLVSVNTDNRTVSNTNLQKEFELLSQIGIGEFEQQKLILNAIETSFADEDTKWYLKTLVTARGMSNAQWTL